MVYPTTATAVPLASPVTTWELLAVDEPVDEPVEEDWKRVWVLRGTLAERRALGTEERAIGLAAYMMKIGLGLMRRGLSGTRGGQ